MDHPTLLVLLLLMFASTINAQFPGTYCGSTGNFAANSTYQTTLSTLLSSISTSNSSSLSYGFFNASAAVPGTSQTLYVFGLSRSDLSALGCRACLDALASDMRLRCPFQMEAVLYGMNCMIRYSNSSFFGAVTREPVFIMSTLINVSDPDMNGPAMTKLLNGLLEDAAGGGSLRKYASGNESAVYAWVQCAPDLTEQQCRNCLGIGSQMIRRCCDRYTGGRFMVPSCFILYETNHRFFDPVIDPLPPPLPPSLSPSQEGEMLPSPPGGTSKSSRIVLAVVGSAVLLVMVIVSVFFFITIYQPKFSSVKKKVKTAESLKFTLSEIRDASDSFSEGNQIGEGAFGKVYRGTLENGQCIAVKRLERYSDQGEQHFNNEVTLMGRLRHNNLIKFLGYCLEDGERLLILEFAPNGSLQGFISDSNKRRLLSWKRRLNIIRGIARGLLYLHDGSRLGIIHRDLKPGNVLLDENMNPKITDFGMARPFLLDQSRANAAQIEGTSGYMAPEYVGRGEISTKIDVYSFGVMVLEIISGTTNSYFSSLGNSEHLLDSAWKNWIKKTPFHLIDPMLNGSSRSELLRCIQIALLCGQENVASRLPMDSVVSMLESQNTTLPMPTPPAYLTDAIVGERSASSVHRCSSLLSTKAEDGSSP